MPAGLKYGGCQDDLGASIIMDLQRFGRNLHHTGNVEGAGGLITDGYKLIFGEGVTILGAEVGIGIRFGLRGTVGQQIGKDAFISALGRVINGDIGCLAQTLDDGAGASPRCDVFGTPAGFFELGCCGAN